MGKKRRNITVCRPMRVKSCYKISQNIIEIVFILQSDHPLALDLLGLGPHVKVLFPIAGTNELRFPSLTAQGKIDWEDGYCPIVRNYSLKHYDPHANEIELYFVNPKVGIGSQWARHAKLGDEVGLLTLSAKCHYGNQYLVLLGDMTALGSIHYILTHLPDVAQGHIYLRVTDESDIRSLPKLAGFQIHWIVGNDPYALIRALEHSRLPQTVPILFWGGMEKTMAKLVRSYLESRFELNQENYQVIPYWHYGKGEGEFSRREGE